MHITQCLQEMFINQMRSDRNAKKQVTHCINDRYLDKGCHPGVYNCYDAFYYNEMGIEYLLITN